MEAGLLVMMSGAIYNRSELAGLDGLDPEVPDPVLVARLFLLHGPGFAERLNGDFAIYLELSDRKEAYLFRDHTGIRPLAYYFEDSSLFFSSDKTGLSRFLSDGRNIDSEYLAGFFKYTDRRKAPCSSVKTLLPGHYLHFIDGKIEISAYWKPSSIYTDRSLTHEQLLADMKHLLRDAVRVRCDSRFTAGGHVSGGLDSSVVVALARDEYHQQDSFYGFSWSPDESLPGVMEDDERDLVRCFCREKKITSLFSDMTTDLLREKISTVLNNRMFFFEDRALDQARSAGVNLVFSGWGGDEFVSTGDRGIELDLLRSFKLRTFFRRNPVRPFRKFVKYFLQYIGYPLLGVRDCATVRFFRNEVRYLKAPFKRSDRKAIRDFYCHSSRRQLHLRLLQSYHIQERCESWAVNGYRKGVEYRYPLLDKRIIEYMLRVPSELLCVTDHFRPLLREISEGLIPEKIRLNWSKVDSCLPVAHEETVQGAVRNFNDGGSIMEGGS